MYYKIKAIFITKTLVNERRVINHGNKEKKFCDSTWMYYGLHYKRQGDRLSYQ